MKRLNLETRAQELPCRFSTSISGPGWYLFPLPPIWSSPTPWTLLHMHLAGKGAFYKYALDRITFSLWGFSSCWDQDQALTFEDRADHDLPLQAPLPFQRHPSPAWWRLPQTWTKSTVSASPPTPQPPPVSLRRGAQTKLHRMAAHTLPSGFLWSIYCSPESYYLFTYAFIICLLHC